MPSSATPSQSLSRPSHTSSAPGVLRADQSSQSPAQADTPSSSLSSSEGSTVPLQSLSTPSHSSGAPGRTVSRASSQSPPCSTQVVGWRPKQKGSASTPASPFPSPSRSGYHHSCRPLSMTVSQSSSTDPLADLGGARVDEGVAVVAVAGEGTPAAEAVVLAVAVAVVVLGEVAHQGGTLGEDGSRLGADLLHLVGEGLAIAASAERGAPQGQRRQHQGGQEVAVAHGETSLSPRRSARTPMPSSTPARGTTCSGVRSPEGVV